jgi:uncharacterized protein (TIGR00255 family)
MILSMTGYGNGSAQKDDILISVEIKTVNHRFLDLHLRLSREFMFLEGEVQQIIRSTLDRGRVDANITIQNAGTSTFQINYGLIRSYIETANKLREELKSQDSLDLKTLLGLPGVLQNESNTQSDSSILTDLVGKSVRQALEGVLRMRRQEGEALRADMLRNLSAIKEAAGNIRVLNVNSAAEYLQKLRDRLSQLLSQGGIDPQRLAQEAALIADKCDISEEVARLESHIAQYYALMDSKEKAGRKLDFLLQEMQREANTILSKSGNLEISGCAIAMKTDIEKLREQVQNVE